MAVLTSTNLTLSDWTKRTDPSGRIPQIANLLEQTNEMLIDSVWRMANDATSHTEVVTTALPTVNLRSFNEGVDKSKGETAQIVEGLSMMEARSEVDVDLANLNGNVQAFRASEGAMFIEAMNQRQQNLQLYGNASTNQKEYNGIITRYNSLSGGNANNIVRVDTTLTPGTASSSVLLVCWSDQTVFGLFPKGSTAGLDQEDLGVETVYTDDGLVSKRMRAYVERFTWKAGLCVKDWRYIVRICNIETAALSNLTGGLAPTSITNLLHKMMQAIAKLPNRRMGRCAFYMNRSVFAALQRIALEKSTAAMGLTPGMSQFGKPAAMLDFQGIPIRQCDALLTTEASI